MQESKVRKTAISHRGSHIIVQSSKSTSTPLAFARRHRQCAGDLQKDPDIGVQITVTLLDGIDFLARSSGSFTLSFFFCWELLGIVDRPGDY